MKYCSKRYKEFWFSWIKWGFQPHLFIITNAFYTLEDPNDVDVIKTCQYCGDKEALVLDKETLLEALAKFPNAFKSIVREYLQTWLI